MSSVLVSGAPQRVPEVSRSLRERGADVTEVTALAELPAAVEAAGPGAFDAYVQLAAAYEMTGQTAVQRVHRFYADGVLARFAALDAVRPGLADHAEVLFVLAVLPPEVATPDDREARRALTRVLARAARADAAPDTFRTRILDAGVRPEQIAALAVGATAPPRREEDQLAGRSLEEWRVELLSVVMLDT